MRIHRHLHRHLLVVAAQRFGAGEKFNRVRMAYILTWNFSSVPGISCGRQQQRNRSK
jgi:hypothetical protein